MYLIFIYYDLCYSNIREKYSKSFEFFFLQNTEPPVPKNFPSECSSELCVYASKPGMS